MLRGSQGRAIAQRDADAFYGGRCLWISSGRAHAFEWPDRAYRQKDSGLQYVKGDWLLRSLERDPRYKAFLKRMNLPE